MASNATNIKTIFRFKSVHTQKTTTCADVKRILWTSTTSLENWI
jgi:hypothetical protein